VDTDKCKKCFIQGDCILSQNGHEDICNSPEIDPKKKRDLVSVQIPRELARDWHRTQNFLRDYVKSKCPIDYETAEEKEPLKSDLETDISIALYIQKRDIFDKINKIKIIENVLISRVEALEAVVNV